MYIDTSALAAYYFPEKLSEKISKKICSKKITISELVVTEFYSAMSLKLRSHQVNMRDANKIIFLFEEHLKEGYYGRLSLLPEDFVLATSWIKLFNTSLRTLDALHLAISHRKNLTLLTTDQLFYKSALKLKVSALYID